MGYFTDLNDKQKKIIGLAASLILHSGVLYCLWNYHTISPESEPLTVFVSNIHTASPAKQDKPTVTKAINPPPIKRELPDIVPHVAPQLLAISAPATSQVESDISSSPTVGELLETVPASLAAASHSINATSSNSEKNIELQPIHLSEELSVNCSGRPAPAYPRLSIRFNEQGKAVLQVELDELGKVTNVTVKVKSGFPRLDEAAINAVKTWHCSPAKRKGVAVRSVALQPFSFVLKGY